VEPQPASEEESRSAPAIEIKVRAIMFPPDRVVSKTACWCNKNSTRRDKHEFRELMLHRIGAHAGKKARTG
jgi:hypothetical protein